MKYTCEIFLLALVVSCTEGKQREVVKEYWDQKQPKEVIIYPVKNDTSAYEIIRYFRSGQILDKKVFEKSKLKSYEVWYENGNKFKWGEYVALIRRDSVFVDNGDTVKVTAIGEYGNKKEWNKNGVLIYEAHILPGRKEVSTVYDSLGKVVRTYTLSY